MENRLALFLGALFLLGAFLVSPAESPAQAPPQEAASGDGTDVTPPVMLFVEHKGVQGEVTHRAGLLKGIWAAEDKESGIRRYRWSIHSGGETIVNDTLTEVEEVAADGLILEDGRVYVFRVSAQNKAGLWSEPLESSGVTVNVILSTESDCSDGEQNGDETDVDCGGSCPKKCEETKGCTDGRDCQSGLCSQELCVTDIASAEIEQQTEEDVDGDGIPDGQDNCPLTSNPGQDDQDEDGQGNECDQDDDNDGMSDLWEEEYELDSLNPDDAGLDKDGDGLSNLNEFGNLTKPNSADSDGDGHDDAKEIGKGTDPTDPDSKPGSSILTIFIWLVVLAIIFGVTALILREKMPAPVREFMENRIAAPVRKVVENIMEKRKATPAHKTGKETAMQPEDHGHAARAHGTHVRQHGLPPLNRNIAHSRHVRKSMDTLMEEYRKISGEQVFKRLRHHTQKKFKKHEKG